jgi:hypothetical protein
MLTSLWFSHTLDLDLVRTLWVHKFCSWPTRIGRFAKFPLVLDPNVNPPYRLKLPMHNSDFLSLSSIYLDLTLPSTPVLGNSEKVPGRSLFVPHLVQSFLRVSDWLLPTSHAIPKDWHPSPIFTSVIYSKDTMNCSRLPLFSSVS